MVTALAATLLILVAASTVAHRSSLMNSDRGESTPRGQPHDITLLAGISMPRLDARCTEGCVRYRRSDWGADNDGRMTKSALPTSGVEWTFLCDGRSVTFHLSTDESEQRRIDGRSSLFVNTREREVTVLCGQHAPGQEGIDEMLIGCEGLAESSAGETLADELARARILRCDRADDALTLTYTLPGEVDGWVHNIEWIAGNAPRITARTLTIPQEPASPSAPAVSRVIRQVVVEWESVGAAMLPKVVDRTVCLEQAGSAAIMVGKSRFEVLERRSVLTPTERSQVGPLTIDAGWSVSRQDRACSAVLGELEFVFAGRRYQSSNPIVLSDLERPELLLAEAQCLE